MDDALSRLKTEFPDWLITTVWASSSSGSDKRLFCAQGHGVTLSAWTPAEMRDKIKAEGKAAP